MRVVPRYTLAVPLDGSDAVHTRLVVSAVPSPSGEKIGAAACGESVGAVVSTMTGKERTARFPATSHVASETAYRPSGTRAPVSSVPVHVQVTVAPLPVRARTDAPPAFVTLIVQRVAPVVASDTRTVSRKASPFGESSEVVADADVTAGGVVSTVMPYAETCVAVAGRADGALYVRPPPTPTSWRTYRPSLTAAPPTWPFQSQLRAPAASAGTATDPTS